MKCTILTCRDRRHRGSRVMTATIMPVLLLSLASLAAVPPRVNYQGVLRDALANPLDGTYDMIFRFYDSPMGGMLLYTDQHLAAGSGGVTVTGGVFNVALGSGVPGSGIEMNFEWVFQNWEAVHVEVQVGGEILWPRVPVASAGFSVSTDYFDGMDSHEFARVESPNTFHTTQTVLSGAANDRGVVVRGAPAQSANLQEWQDASGAALASVGPGGTFSGNGSGLTSVDAATLDGLDGSQILNTSGARQTKVGRLTLIEGISAYSVDEPSVFSTFDGFSAAFLATSGGGIDARGSNHGGHFWTDATGDAYLGFGDIGIWAQGDSSGGYFTNRTPPVTGSAEVGKPGVGIDARGTSHAGHMVALGASGEAWLGRGHVGVEATGQSYGGAFSGGAAAGLFEDATDLGLALVARGDVGIDAHGTYGTSNTGEGGRFCDRLWTGQATLADGDTGVIGTGSFAGAIFRHATSDETDCDGTTWDNATYLATPTSAIQSAAPKNFIQNHPHDPTQLIVYTSLEGDEVGTYTRGAAVLTGGVARVALGATFAWVTNPDIGLTAHVTPRGTWSDLYVESLSTSEIVVRSHDGTDGRFDYVVYGLRIGFEEASVVRERDVDARMPSMAPHEELYAARPELRELNALERFRRMREATGESGALDLARSRELLAAIGARDADHEASNLDLLAGPVAPDPVSPLLAEAVLPGPHAQRDRSEGDEPRFPAHSFPVPVAGAVEAGEVLANDALLPGTLRPAVDPASAGVVGIVAGDPGTIWRGEAPLALAGTVVACKADASYGAIGANDLLAASPTPGHAMRAPVDLPGTVLGKALEPLEAGTGSIRVLVMPR